MKVAFRRIAGGGVEQPERVRPDQPQTRVTHDLQQARLPLERRLPLELGPRRHDQQRPGADGGRMLGRGLSTSSPSIAMITRSGGSSSSESPRAARREQTTPAIAIDRLDDAREAAAR